MQTKILPAKYVMKTDDDAFVRIDEILSTLKEKASDGLLYGLISFESSPHRETDSKWYISVEVYIQVILHLLSRWSLHLKTSLIVILLDRNGHMLHSLRGPMVQVILFPGTLQNLLFKGTTKEISG